LVDSLRYGPSTLRSPQESVLPFLRSLLEFLGALLALMALLAKLLHVLVTAGPVSGVAGLSCLLGSRHPNGLHSSDLSGFLLSGDSEHAVTGIRSAATG
jgi:hypothetical protein